MQSEPLRLKASCDVRKSDSFSHIYYDNFSHLPVIIMLSWVFFPLSRKLVGGVGKLVCMNQQDLGWAESKVHTGLPSGLFLSLLGLLASFPRLSLVCSSKPKTQRPMYTLSPPLNTLLADVTTWISHNFKTAPVEFLSKQKLWEFSTFCQETVLSVNAL